ncbi:YtxH domain-containing protein [Schaalia vaccimaxillae]|uniref:YtxH domain-containing protein n=1 Tax=Schaalia vaccimaxillae TaxID=183916 RepID=UPI0003B39023|nr:YtxH domain-containing protein [Schaalia vaccimaxillae]
MGTKIGILLGAGVGYVLGTRAGREQYEKLRATASKLRRIPVVAKPLDRAGEKMSDIVREQGERVTDKVADAVKERLFGAPPSSSQTPPSSTNPKTAPTTTVEANFDSPDGHAR